MHHVAFTTMGVLLEPWGHPGVQGFVDRTPDVFAHAERAAGFIDRSRIDPETGLERWGPFVAPKSLNVEANDLRFSTTLSVWRDLDSVAAFTYREAHLEALRLRREWFVHVPGFPTHAAWWIEEGHTPTWAEAAERFDALVERGPSPEAFPLRTAFDAEGHPYSILRLRE